MSKYPNKSKYTDKNHKEEPSTLLGDQLVLNQFFNSSSLYVDFSQVTDAGVCLFLQSSNLFGVCPYCDQMSCQVHSIYIRALTDLPILGQRVTLRFRARKFFCKNDNCSKRTFAEQPGGEIYRYRRRTKRCERVIEDLAIRMSAPATILSLQTMEIPVSSSTVLRTIYRIDIPSLGVVTELGVDDWAFRKGVTYGTILVNMQTGDVIDLLADRETTSFEQWINSHPEVILVSRDRSTDYSSAIANTGRSIIEVADRFHLVKNMTDCITKVISENYAEYRRTLTVNHTDEPHEPQNDPIDKLIINEKIDSRTVLFNEVKELQSKGFNISVPLKLGRY